MLIVDRALASYRLAAGEPWLLYLYPQNVDGTPMALDGRAFALVFRAPDRTTLGTIDAELATAVTGMQYLEFVEDGLFSERLYGKVGTRVELTERFHNGRSLMASGALKIDVSAKTVADFANGPIGLVATKVVVRLGGAVMPVADVAFVPFSLVPVQPAPSLAALSLSTSSIAIGVATTIGIIGATAGSTLFGAVPDGMTLDSAARTIAGTPTTAGAYQIAMRETPAGGGTARTTNLGLEVRAATPAPTPTPGNVTAYGAQGDSDGVTAGSGADNTSAFNQAIAAVQAAGGGTVLVPAGTYRLATPRIAVTASNVYFDGVGTMFFDSTDTAAFGRLAFDGGLASGEISSVGVRGALRITNLAGVEVSGPEPGYPGNGCLLTLRGCASFSVESVNLRNSPNYAVSVLRSRDGTITNVTGQDCIADGVHIQDDCHRVTVNDPYFTNMGDDIIGLGYYGAANSDITINNARGSGCGACGIAIYGGNAGVIVNGGSIDSTYNAGLKIVPLSKRGGATNRVSGVVVDGLELTNAGMRSRSAFSRGDGLAVGIHLAPSGGTIADVTLKNMKVTSARNSFLYVDNGGGGVIQSLTLTDANFNGIAATGGQGATTSGSTGFNQDTPDASHPGVLIDNNVTSATLARNSVTGAVGTPIINRAGNAPVAGPIATDDFQRADVAPAAGALGNTKTGGKVWVGAAAGISNGQAYLATGGYNGTAIDCGTSNVDVYVEVTVTSDVARVIARSDNDPSNGAACILISSGTLGYYDGANFYVIATFPALQPGAHGLNLKVVGNTATAFVDGRQVATGSPSVTMNTNTFAGFQDGGGAGGTVRYDNFTVEAK